MMTSKKLLVVTAALAVGAVSFMMAGCVEKSTSPSSYKITAEAGTGGKVSFDDPTKTNYAKGDLVTVTAVPNAGYVFAGWEGAPAGKERENPLEITVEKALTLKATFIQAHPLNIVANPTAAAGQVKKDPDKTGYDLGDTVTLTATSPTTSTYGFYYWGDDSTAAGAKDSVKKVVITENTTVKVAFKTKYALPLEIFPRKAVGTVDASNIQGPHFEGAVVNIVAQEADTNYVFNYWELTGTTGATKIADSLSKNTTITIGPDSNLKLVANYRQVKKMPGVQTTKLTDNRETGIVGEYDTVQIGNYTWFARNLNYDPASSGNSWCYGDDDANCEKYGRLYDWETAVAACPTGWHLPNWDEWNHLRKVVNIPEDPEGVYFALSGKPGWGVSGSQGGDDALGFKALPGGKREGTAFDGVLTQAYWWSATPDANAVDTRAFNRSIIYGNDNTKALADNTVADKANGYSVRCVKESYTTPK